jgi:hypothetical protein
VASGPPKPAFGQPCNRCGVCCAAGPCGLSSRLLGTPPRQRCPALERDDDGRFACGLVRNPQRYVPLLSYAPEALGAEFAQHLQIGGGCDASYAAGLILTE